MNMKKICIAVASALCCTAAAAQSYSNIYFFGDSSTDNGTFRYDLTGSGRLVWSKYTELGGNMWSENLGAGLGFSVKPHYSNTAGTPNSVVQGTGNNFAIGGSMYVLPGNRAGSLPVAQQVADAIASSGGRLDGRGIYVVRAAGNELVQGAFVAGGLPYMTTVAGTAADQVQALRNAGANYVIFANTGLIDANGIYASLAPYQAEFDKAYNNAIRAKGTPVLTADLTGLMTDVFANYARYGFATAAFTPKSCATYDPNVVSAINCASLTAANAGTQYFYTDNNTHFSSGVQKIQSDYALAMLRAPQQAALLAEIPLTFSQQTGDVLAGRQRLYFDGLAPTNGNNLYLVGSYGKIKYDAANGMDSNVSDDSYGFTLGYDRVFGTLQAGVALSSYNTKPGIGYGGHVKSKGVLGAAYGTLPINDFFVGGFLAYGNYDQSLNRVIPLGITQRSEQGTADATQASAQINGGYLFKGANWYHGPRIEYTYSKVKVDAFAESSGSFSAMRYGAQTRESQLASLGYLGSLQLSGTPVRLNGSLAYSKDLQDRERHVTVGVATTAGDLGLPVGRDNKGFWQANLGVSSEVAKNLLLSAQVNLNSSNASGLSSGAYVSLNWTGW